MVARSINRAETGSNEIERHGFSLVYSPSPGHVIGEEPAHSCNIVFVHGLRGDPRTTWEYVPEQVSRASKQRTSKQETPKQKPNLFAAFSRSSRHPKIKPQKRDGPSQKVYWPASILPQEVERARIWTYGYDADVISGFFRANNKNSILQHANDLKVKLERTLNDSRPIIFVTHSLGGIIVKRALSEMESSKDEGYLSLLNRVFYVVFCGCPHRGADAAGWGILLSRLATVALAAPTTQLLSDLEIDSQILDMIQDDFLRTLHHHSLRVYTFLEAKGMAGIKGLNDKIVNDFSGKIGWSEGERTEYINADHREMVREPGAKIITSVLKDIEKKSYHRNIPHAVYPYLDSFYTFDYKSVLDNVVDPYRHTCTWISTLPPFVKWLAGEYSTTFWLHGYPGLGKSVITKYLLKNVIDNPPVDKRSRQFVLYFFCSYQLSNAQSYTGLFSSLIHQLLAQRPDLAGHAGSLKNPLGFFDPGVHSVTKLQKIFEDLLYYYFNPDVNKTRYGSVVFTPTLYIVIDALDELDRSEWNRFFATFGDLINTKDNTKFRLLITSRTEPEFEEKLAESWDYDLGATEQNSSDVAEYIKGTVSDYGQRNNFGDENILDVISEITAKAEGMFLWATLAWSLFTEGVGMWTRTLVQRKLEGLRQVPSGIESLYHRLLDLVDKEVAGELLAALKWIVAASEPLSVDEIAVALSLRARPRHKRHLDIPFNMRAFLRNTCLHLIKIDDSGHIKLIHLSFRSFLVETEFVRHEHDLTPNPFYFALKPVNYEVGVDCLSYITLEDFSQDPLEKARQNMFFSYCHKYWIHHLESLENGFEEVSVYFFRLLDFETKKLRWYDTNKMIFQLWDRGLTKLFEPATRFGVDLNVFDDNGDHFIHHVCNGPNGIIVEEKSVRWLVGLGVDLNGRTHLGQTVLHMCLITWHDALCHPDIDGLATNKALAETLKGVSDTCKRLLSYPTIDLNATDRFWFSPLSYAIYWGMTDAMNILLECPYLQAEKGHSALHIAAREGLFGVVNQLLAGGADVYACTSQGESALHLAAAGGHWRILQLLVANADPELLNAKDRRIDPLNPYANTCYWNRPNGWTPLHLAVTSGHDGLVLWLINHPRIDLDIKDKHGRKAIAFAAAFGTKTMLKAFLSRDPEQVAHKDLFGNGLLHMASLGSNRENLDLLFSLEHPPDVGPNKWGNSIADLAPTLAVDLHLHDLGFVHSHAREASCLQVLARNLQHMETTPNKEPKSAEVLASHVEEADSSQWLMMLLPHRFDPDYWQYALKTTETALCRIPASEDSRNYVFRMAYIILDRIDLTAEIRKWDLEKLQSITLRRHAEVEEHCEDDLQKLKCAVDYIIGMTLGDRKDDLQRLKDILDHL